MRFVCSLAALLVAATSSQLVVASNATYHSSRVAVHIPISLHDDNGEEHVQAEFGFVQSSGSISQYVYYTNSFLCDPLVNHTTGFPSGGFQRPFIMMANRGLQREDPCSFVTKARHAQEAGAAALVIADTRCRCSDQECMNDTHSDECETVSPALVNDGSGADVSIPSFLLYKMSADKIKKEVQEKDYSVLMELAWGLPKDYDSSGEKQQDDDSTSSSLGHVWYHLWTTAHDPNMDVNTYVNMRTVAVALQEQAHFAPRFSLIQGSQFQCTDQDEYTDGGSCDHLCTNHGRYCAIGARNVSGHAIVTETLRRLCIWKHYGEAVKDEDGKYEHEDPVVWWDYVIYHREHCYDPDKYADDVCLTKALEHSKVKMETIDQCMSDSGGLDDDNTNTILEDMITRQERSGVVSLPALTLQNQVLDHTSSYGLFESICRHFWTSNGAGVPEMCETCGACPNTIGCLENKGKCVPFSSNDDHHSSHSGGNGDQKKSSQSKKGGHGWTLFWLSAMAAIGGGGYYYYKQREEQNGREGGILNHYMQLGGEA